MELASDASKLSQIYVPEVTHLALAGINRYHRFVNFASRLDMNITVLIGNMKR